MSSLNAPCLHVAHIRYTDDAQAWQVHCPRSGPLKPTKVEAVNAWNAQLMEAAGRLLDGREHNEFPQAGRAGEEYSPWI